MFNDIVRWPENDAYSLLSSKVMWGLNHSLYEYKTEPYDIILKTDDDSFINIAAIFNHMKHIRADQLYYGGHLHVIRQHHTHRFRKNKVFREMYSPSFQLPKRYMFGAGYMLSWSLVGKMAPFHVLPTPCEVEDVYTGYLVEKVPDVTIQAFSRDVISQTSRVRNFWKRSMIVHHLSCRRIRKIFKWAPDRNIADEIQEYIPLTKDIELDSSS